MVIGLHGFLGASAAGRQNVNLCSQNRIEEQVGSNVIGLRFHDSPQIDDRAHAAAPSGGSSFHHVIGLRSAISKDGVAALLFGVVQQIFQFTNFVAAEECRAGEVFPLYPKIDVISRGNAFEFVKRRWIKA